MKIGKLTVRTDNDPCLRKKSEMLKRVGPAERLLMEAMIETMYEKKGIGLAAPQVGVNQQIFVVDVGDGPFVVVNPKVLKKSGWGCMEEGCLSLPGTVVNVRRAKKVRVQYLDQDNNKIEKDFSDLLARVFLHETDHLLGKLIVDYVGWPEKIGLRKRKPAKKEDHKGKVI